MEPLEHFREADRYFEPKVTRMRFVPTRRYWLVTAAGIPVVAFLSHLGYTWSFWVVNGLLFLIALMSYWVTPSLDAIQFRRRMDAVLSVRGRNQIQLELLHEGHVPISGILRDELPGMFRGESQETRFEIAPGQLFQHRYVAIAPERGEQLFRGTFVRLNCPFGLVHRQVELDTRQEVKVYPNLLALREFMLLNQSGRLREMGIRKAKLKGKGTEFESLRDYVVGDDYRKLDWKATARRGKLIIREYEVERNQVVMICLDCGRHMLSEIDGVRKLDLVLDSVLMVIQSAITAGDNVGLLAYGEDIHAYVPPQKGQRQLGVLLNAMYGLVAEPVESDAVRAFTYYRSRQKRRALIMHFTAVEDIDRSKEVIQSFGMVARANIALQVNVTDPELRQILRKIPENRSELHLHASAMMLTDERRQAAKQLASANIRVLESEPQDLADALVGYYMEVKVKGQL